MLLESDYNNDDKICRKAYHVDNPVQAKRSSGYRMEETLKLTP